MSNKLFDKLAQRLLSKDEVGKDESLDETFTELQEQDFASISAAHTSDHGAGHYSQIQ